MSVIAMLQGTDSIDRATTQTALALARRLNVALTGLCPLPDPNTALMVVSTPEAGGMMTTVSPHVHDLQKQVLDTAEAAFRDVASLGAHGLPVAFRHEVDAPEHAAVNAATLADAIVFPRAATSSAEPLSLAFDAVLMEARLPVVLTGAGAPERGPVIVAWDGSNGSARALRFHGQLIRSFGEVIIAHQPHDAKRQGARPISEPEALHAWLAERHVDSRIAVLEGDVGEALLALAKASNAAMIVAGAYGHSRLGERLFGGTTRRLLSAKDAPALALAR